jgi:hypothetical protein
MRPFISRVIYTARATEKMCQGQAGLGDRGVGIGRKRADRP